VFANGVGFDCYEGCILTDHSLV